MATTARYQDKVAEALAKVLAIPEKAPPPRVVIRLGWMCACMQCMYDTYVMAFCQIYCS